MRFSKQPVQAKNRNISYRIKDPTVCPICKHEFNREQLHSGGGRLIAGKLTRELRRLYDVSKKYGRIYPIGYSLIVCPQCMFSSFPSDFDKVNSEEKTRLQKKTLERRSGIEKIVGPLDFNEDRNLVLGAASYILAISSYQDRERYVAPTPKKAICSLRGAWLFDEMESEFPKMGFDKIRDFLYMKAIKYYDPVLDIMSTGSEPHEPFINLLGPDTDQNWGFDGVIYLNGFFCFEFLDKIAQTPQEKIALLERNKRFLGKLYGMGRSSKSKPSILIDMAKDLYDDIQKKLESLQV